MTVLYEGVSLSWLGYACLKIDAPTGPTIYTDPGRYGTLDGTWAEQYGGMNHPTGPEYNAQDGDIVVVTHDHHYDSDGVRRVASDDATVLVYDAVDVDRIADNGRDVESPESLPYEVIRVSEGDEYSLGEATVSVIPAYNYPDGPNVKPSGEPMHPKGFGCGYVLSIDGRSYCWPGDSDVIDDHTDLDVSVLLPSISSSFTMDRHDAATLASEIRPDLVLPIHYNTFDALQADSRAFAADVASQQVPVVLDEPGLENA